MAEQEQTELLREVDEELRQERLLRIWKTYGVYFVAAALMVVMIVGGYQGWRFYETNARRIAGETFAKAETQAAAGNLDQALVVLTQLQAEGTAGYATLARFRRAALTAEQDGAAAASVAYFAIADDAETGPIYRDLATLLGTLHGVDTGDPARLGDRLQPLLAESNPWRHMARELAALLAYRGGDPNGARELLTALARDVSAPDASRRRANELLAVFGS